MWTIDEYDPDIPYSKRTHGTCTCCGESDVDLIILNDDDHICTECLESDYQKCDECGEYWPIDMVDFIGEKAVCSYCPCSGFAHRSDGVLRNKYRPGEGGFSATVGKNDSP